MGRVERGRDFISQVQQAASRVHRRAPKRKFVIVNVCVCVCVISSGYLRLFHNVGGPDSLLNLCYSYGLGEQSFRCANVASDTRRSADQQLPIRPSATNQGLTIHMSPETCFNLSTFALR